MRDDGLARTVAGISKSWDDADFQSWARNTFDPVPKFVYSELPWSSTETVGIFTIERVPGYPHVSVRTVGDVLFDGQVWLRQGTQNRVAHRAELRTMFMGEEAFKFSRINDPEFERVIRHYQEEGEELSSPRFHDKDSCLARGYRIAYYPGTRREIWVGFHAGQFEHIAMLEPKT